MIVPDRSLTIEKKLQVLERWDATKADFLDKRERGLIVGDTGGLGYPDPEIFHLCDRLNRLRGIVTTQSCSGHLHKGQVSGEDAMWSGELWIAMTFEIELRYLVRIDQLLRHPEVENARLLFFRGELDAASVVFQGMNKGQLVFGQSSQIIFEFFRAISSGGYY